MNGRGMRPRCHCILLSVGVVSSRCLPQSPAAAMGSPLIARPLHYVIKVGDRKKSYDFYVGTLGMKVLRHEEFTEGCAAECNGPYNGKWSKTMVGYGDESANFVIEMTYNYEIGGYHRGNDLHGMYVDNAEVFNRLTADGASCWDEGSRLRLRDPDGNPVYVGGGAARPVLSQLALNVQSLDKSIDFWSGVLGMSVVVKEESFSALSYPSDGQGRSEWSLRLLSLGHPLNRATAYGRTAFSCPTNKLEAIEASAAGGGWRVLKPLVSLDTPGKATVRVVILADPDGHEICFVGDEAFRELCKVDPEADAMLLKEMAEDWSLEWFKDGKPTV